MRVVSLIPSWTETLLEAGVNVVGRTRFCVYPADKVRNIPAVAGTKNWDFAAIKALKPDLLLLDKEENPKWMAEQTEIPVFSTHITSIQSMPGALAQMALRFHNAGLVKLATRWDSIQAWRGLSRWEYGEPIPGFIEWGREPERPIRNVVYVIWRNPWMTVSRSTFIGSMLSTVGFGPFLRDFPEKYPRFNIADYEASETLLLFSSEPYPFLRKKDVLNPLFAPYAFVDGERFSWFGMRSLRFLEELRSRDMSPSP